MKLYIKSKSRYVEYLLNLVGVHCDDITSRVSTLFNVTVLIILYKEEILYITELQNSIQLKHPFHHSLYNLLCVRM